jgi:ubiquinone/menaquinone biosynthesis C-methylase UbiE/uncharacterized protein YbaR (Trm112 family)
MTRFLLGLLIDPITKDPLELKNEYINNDGNIISGILFSKKGEGGEYPIINGIPRFEGYEKLDKSVESFGNQWNRFNFDKFKMHWLEHTMRNSFDNGVEDIKDKIIIDAGGGAGMQSYWLLESGAKHVVMMDLSNTVDNVVQFNFKDAGFINFDIIQCSIDNPPIRQNSINGIVLCHNVIQHTPSIEKTAKALFAIVASGSEFVFNTYGDNKEGYLRTIRWAFYLKLRIFLVKKSDNSRLIYSYIMGILWFVPILGWVLRKSMMIIKGNTPKDESESLFEKIKRTYYSVVTNTYDWYGSHSYQHHITNGELKKLLYDLQPDEEKILNQEKYYSRNPVYDGASLRVVK